MRVTVTKKDGSIWKPKSTSDYAGWDSYVELKEGFVTVTDEFGHVTTFPASEIERVDQEQRPRL